MTKFLGFSGEFIHFLAAPWMAASMTNKPLSLVQLHGIFKQGIWVGTTPVGAGFYNRVKHTR
jgi:hypothetical protein